MRHGPALQIPKPKRLRDNGLVSLQIAAIAGAQIVVIECAPSNEGGYYGRPWLRLLSETFRSSVCFEC
jgi:hypothetical protein